MNAFGLDRLTMLLSTDWFLSHWHLIGIFADEGNKRALQRGSRDVVRELMSGQREYWNVDFGVERVRKTRSAFYAIVERCSLPATSVDRIKVLVSGEEGAVDEGTRWLLVSMTEQLLDNSIVGAPDVNVGIKEALERDWRRSDEIDFKEICLSSTSEWDQYLSSTTPDLPAMLADYVYSVASQSKFEVLWGFIFSKLSVKQRHELFTWYRSAAESLTGEPLRLPHEA